MASAALLIFVTVAIGSSQMVAIGTLSEELFHINATVAIIVLGLSILTYTALGGMLAVGYTNVMHVLVMYAGSILLSHEKNSIKERSKAMYKTIEAYVSSYAKETPDKPAVIVDGAATSYRELYDLVCGYASFLVQSGLKKGDVVVAKSSQTLDYVVIYLGIHLAGGVVTSLEKSISVEGIVDVIHKVGAKMVICDDDSIISHCNVIYINQSDVLEKAAHTEVIIESATAPLPEPDKEHLCELLPNTRLYNNYGSSESASCCMYNYNVHRGKTGCVGKAMPNSKIFIVNDNREIIQSSKTNMGLLACVGDVNMKGYINEPELSKEVLVDGVLYTNDIGYIDEEGFIYVSGRKGDVINVGGLKVAPTEVESAALSYDGIEDCICLPVAHPITGQALKLLVVLREGTDFSSKQISEYLKTKLENYKVPTKYEQVEKIERTYNGKLNRKAYL